ncbi:MAG: hypothetical protein ABSD20_05185, partial [Terriglobales bacterium]
MRVFLTAVLLVSSLLAAQQAAPPVPPSPPPVAPKEAPFTVRLAAPLGDLPVGSEQIIAITFTNTSLNPVFFPRIAGKLALDLFMKMDVHDQEGKPVPETPERIKARHLPLRPYHSRPELKAGDSEIAEVTLNQDYDLTKPGKYTVQVSATDPASHAVATSNTLTVNVLPPKE